MTENRSYHQGQEDWAKEGENDRDSWRQDT
jgi:hypothetical protein